ncbi:MAG: FAD-dependent oxidoreductase [Candidatus Tectomicrobia bacterium]|nr:FAD-dependent oxidoreductase [Candidatus Tectomicrobia bacterium]
MKGAAERVHTVGVLRMSFRDQRSVRPVYDFEAKTSPCREACPAGHDIAAALHLAREGRFDAALALFLAESPFPSITGRVCYHPCEAACNRASYDGAVHINLLERAAAEHGRRTPAAAAARRGERVAIIGAGPAGLTAAYHLLRWGYRVTVYERHTAPGGMLRYGIPEYRLPARIVEAETERLAALGLEYRLGCRVGQDVAFQDLLVGYDAVFLAAGLAAAKKLPVPGVGDVPAKAGIDFLRRVREGTLRRVEGSVLVIGGGDVAIDAARTAARLGAADVQLYCLEDRQTMPAHPEEISEAEREGIGLHPAWAPIRFAPRAAGLLAEFRGVERLEQGRPVLTEAAAAHTADLCLYAIGQEAMAPFLPSEMFENGRLLVNELGQTRLPSLFAGGDLTGTYSVVQAIGSAKRAALGIDCHLRGRDARELLPRLTIGAGPALSLRRYEALSPASDGQPAPRSVTKFAALNLDYFPRQPRGPRPQLSLAARRGFSEVNLSLAEEAARQEGRRCFNCGACTVCGNCFTFCPDAAVLQLPGGYFTIDEERCKGCGVCVEECPRAAMSMVQEAEVAP